MKAWKWSARMLDSKGAASVVLIASIRGYHTHAASDITDYCHTLTALK
jgi:hypothetical protein